MGSTFSTNQNTTNEITQPLTHPQQGRRDQSRNNKCLIHNQTIQLNELNKQLIHQYHPQLDSIQLLSMTQQTQYMTDQDTKQGYNNRNKLQKDKNKIQKEIQFKRNNQEMQFHTHNQQIQTTSNQEQGPSNSLRQSHSSHSFRSSFISDQTQSTIYLSPPQFILQSPFLMNILNKTLYEFFSFSQFIGILAIKFYRIFVKFVFIQLVINFILCSFTEIDCLKALNNGLMPLDKWMLLDCVLTSFILILIGMHTYLMKNFILGSRRRGSQYLHRSITIIQTSWIVIYCLKFFVTNTIGSAQFFTYTIRQTSDNSNQVERTQINPMNSFFNEQSGHYYCSSTLNSYLTIVMIYNYVSVVFLCVYVIQNLV